jgi:hypothetical protein
MKDIIDFEDAVISDWTNKLIAKYPQLLRDNYGRSPGYPQDPIPYMINKHISPDWDAWYLYYNMCRASGMEIEYGHIANILERTNRTVKGAFITVRKKLEEESWKLLDNDW